MVNDICAIAVMASGRGTNLKVIMGAAARGECPVEVRLVISDKADAPALAIARAGGVPHIVHLDPKAYENREAFDHACAELIAEHNCHWIVLAGYMRVLSESFVHGFANRIINIHPSLLPAFVGGKAVADALAHGVKVAGCTVHLVSEELDGGPILAQAAVPVLDDDSVESLHARIQVEEHSLYPTTLKRMVNEGFNIVGRRVIWKND